MEKPKVKSLGEIALEVMQTGKPHTLTPEESRRFSKDYYDAVHESIEEGRRRERAAYAELSRNPVFIR